MPAHSHNLLCSKGINNQTILIWLCCRCQLAAGSILLNLQKQAFAESNVIICHIIWYMSYAGIRTHQHSLVLVWNTAFSPKIIATVLINPIFLSKVNTSLFHSFCLQFEIWFVVVFGFLNCFGSKVMLAW